jgi:hypothetical protein
VESGKRRMRIRMMVSLPGLLMVSKAVLLR